MHYIPNVKRRLEELKLRWMRRKLSQAELFELYDLLDAVIVEARRARSAFLPEQDAPEHYLVFDFLKGKIQSEVERFLFRFGLLRSKDTAGKGVEEKSTLLEWLGYAQQITRTIILGDATERPDRIREIEKFEKSKGPDACLVLNYNWLYSHRDKLLGEEGTHKKISTVLNPESLNREDKKLRNLDWDGMDARWNNENDKLDEWKGAGFFIKDRAAVHAAERMAKEFKQRTKKNPYHDKPTGYVPGYQNGEMRQLKRDKAFAEQVLNDWRLGEYPDIKNEQECVAWIESPQIIGRKLSDVSGPIEIPESRPNFILYTFGKTGKHGLLYRRLREFKRSRDKHLKNSAEVSSSERKIPMKPSRTVWEKENDESLLDDRELSTDEENEDSEDQTGLLGSKNLKLKQNRTVTPEKATIVVCIACKTSFNISQHGGRCPFCHKPI